MRFFRIPDSTYSTFMNQLPAQIIRLPLQLSASLMQLPARLSRSLDCLPEHTARLEHQVASGWHRIHTRLGHAGLDAPVDYLLQQRRAKLHRAAVLALLLMATLGTDDVQAHSQPGSTTKTRPASITGPAGAGTAPAVTRAATNAATTAAMNAATTAAAIPVSTSALPPSSPATTEQRLDKWLRQQPGYPRGKSVTTQLTVVRAPRTSHLPPCQQTEYFLAAGARLWGRINVGERCTADAQWTAWHAVQLRVQGPALVARQQLAAGSMPQPGDFTIQQVDWTQYPSPPVATSTVLAGQELQRTLTAGQPLRAEHLRTAPRIRSGETVMAIAQGDGFRIATDAVALASAGEGQSIRVRTPAGKVLTGLVEGKNVIISR